MKILITAVGRLGRGPANELFEEYRRRLLWPLTLKEVAERRPLPPARLKAREGELLLAALPKGPVKVVALDERGESLDSAAFARRLGRWRDEGCAVAFLIGGADGLADAVRARADLVLSLGRMTWPHALVRALLMEQLYRAQAILSGHPYHRE